MNRSPARAHYAGPRSLDTAAQSCIRPFAVQSNGVADPRIQGPPIRPGMGLAHTGTCDCIGSPMHITASVFINDDESGLHQDNDRWLEKIAPHEPTSQYRHNDTGEDNADAHIKRQIMGREVVAVAEGRLDFGTCEQIFYGEFDGQRRKRGIAGGRRRGRCRPN